MKIEKSPLDSPVYMTVFDDRRALVMKEGLRTMRQLAARIPRKVSAGKDQMGHIKLARFSGEKTVRGSYRHNDALLAVSGVEGDYDAGEMSVDEALGALKDACVAAIVYTTPSHQKNGKGHRWRVFCPLSEEVLPDRRAQLAARVNGILGGVLSGESFTASQSFAFGAVAGRPPPEVRIVDGRFLDHCDDLDAGAIGKSIVEKGEPEIAVDMSGDGWKVEWAATMLERAAERLAETDVERNAGLCREAYLAGGLLANNLVTREQVMEAFLPAMTENGYLDDHAGGSEAEVERIIDAQLEAGAREPFDPAGGSDE